MALNKHSASRSQGASRAGNGAENRANGQASGESHSGEDWINGSWVATQQAFDWLNQFHRTMLQAVISWNETLASAAAEISKARNPMQMLAAESDGVNRQMETLVSQQADLLQLMFDSQLNLLNKIFREVEPTQATSSQTQYGKDLLCAWGKAQDEWLKISKGLIDSARSAQAGQKSGV